MIDYEFFTKEELACRCGECDGGAMNPFFMKRLIDMRRSLGFPFHVSSGFRCKIHNENVGGTDGSLHVVGNAVDLLVRDERALSIISKARQFGFNGIGIKQSGKDRFVHIDDRLIFAMWTY
ncbi:MAG: peptidase M15 [Deltaproteobacteria bacterium]|nr:MAG: peptidase M15 [Deltaproteobacteria bacterium]